MLRFECNDVDAKGKSEHIGAVEVALSDIVMKANRVGMTMPLLGPHKNAGSLILLSDEKTKSTHRVRLDI